MENNDKTELNAQNQPSCLGGVSGSYIWLVEDCGGGSILSAHLTEVEAQNERNNLRNGYAPSIDFRVYSVVIS